ncbi:MAG TPA: cupin domain-containing protein [Burkholderiaceae bacterium]|nr:cupin domain-containing protein [Burkholderiaceae bacterium]
MANEPLTHLGKLPVADFMRRYWQRRPLLVRQAMPGLVAPVPRADLFALARRDDVESRLVTSFSGWRLQHGPVRTLPSVRRPRWTLLVQGVDCHDERAATLLARFRFVSDARLDDLMVSYATDGGGVGPHVDAYDVFLLQAAGRRRWRIGPCHDPRPRPGLPLAILRRFTPTQEWVLEPGDLLYLPPGVAHEGTAVGHECITCSIGFRAPAWRELVDPWLDTLASRWRPAGRYRDPGAPATRHPGRLPAAMIDAAFAQLSRLRPRRTDAELTLLAELTDPKPQIVFEPPHRPLSLAKFIELTARSGLRLDRRTRMLYAGARVAVNGELFEVPAAERRLLQTLADRRALPPAALRDSARAACERLWQWYRAGWLHPGEQER